MNRRLTSAITFHDVLHRFQEGRKMGTNALDTKLLQQLSAMREVVLFKIFLDLQKAYNELNRDRCLVIITAYGGAHRMI